MIEVRKIPAFERWLDSLADRRGAEKIAQRIVRLGGGLFGDVKALGGGLNEMRIDYGPGYRLYFVARGASVVILLCGGDKTSQRRDIKAARVLAAELED